MSESPPPVTYKAYCAAVFHQLNNFNKLVIRIETKLNKQDETITLSSVVEELTPGLNMLQYLYNIHTRAVTDWHSHAPWVCATRLLSVLYEALLETADEMYLETSLDIFIRSFHVYLDIIDVWLSEGRLEDWRKEFLVIREAGELQVMPYEQEMRKCGVTPVSLLSKLVTVVRDAGHTIEVVSQLNKLPKLRDTVSNKGCLFKEFSENVYNEVEKMKGNVQLQNIVSEKIVNVSFENSTTDVDNIEHESEDKAKALPESCCLPPLADSGDETCLSQDEDERIDKREEKAIYLQVLTAKAMYDQTVSPLLDNPLLFEALHSYYEATSNEQTSQAQARPFTFTSTFPSVHSVGVVGLMSIHSVLEKQLELIITRHTIALHLVTQTLRADYSLLEHFTVLRTVFFMESGSLAQCFYSYLFKEIETGMWNNSLSLSVQLQLSVEEFYPGFGKYFTVLVGSKCETNNVYKAIPAVSLAYKLDWPVSSVITHDTIDSYNKVFRFLLNLKYALWTLQNTRFSDLACSKNTLRVRRLHVLKMWMYHSTNTLHAYFMGLVLRSFSSHLDHSICHADSVHTIIQAHIKFLDDVKVHCLQDKKSHVELFIMKLLRLCSSLSKCWEKEAGETLVDSDLHNLETEYIRAYRGLLHCLEVVTEEATDDNLLCELKNEISHSIPEPFNEDS